MASTHLNESQLGSSGQALSADELRKIDAYWRACNYLCAGMIYLHDNPLLKEPLRPEHFKNRLLGHWGSDPGQTFTWVHLNRLIRKYDLNMIYISGPGHGAPATLSNCYLEGTYSEIYPEKSQDEAGMLKLFRAFSFPGQLGSHCTPEVPGSIHEGGELGYSISHAFGAAFDNPDLIVNVVVGDGEAETGPLGDVLAFQQVSEPDPRRRRPAHPASERLQDRQSHAAGPHHSRGTRRSVQRLWMDAVCSGRRRPCADVHQQMAATLEDCIQRIRSIQEEARRDGQAGPSTLADDHSAHAQGMDWAETSGRPQGGGLLARPPGAGAGRANESGASADRRAVDAQLSAPGALRPTRRADSRSSRSFHRPETGA